MPALLLIIIVLTTGCVPKVAYDYESGQANDLLAQVLYSEVEQPAPEVELLTLSPEIKALLDANIDRKRTSNAKLRRLRALLFSEDELNIHYEASSTLTATETFNRGAGNCLSMTTLFVAAARYVGIEARYQTVRVEPTWDREGMTMIRYEHIVATGDSNQGEWVVDFLPDFLIGDAATARITDEAALSLFYNNRGAEALVDGRKEEALAWLQRALVLRPQFSDGWNNMGAVQKRLGQPELAEFSYRQALLHDAENYSALSNLAQLYKSEGRAREARSFERRVQTYRQQNPYFHFNIAQLLYNAGEFEEAQGFLKRSIRLKRDEPDFYVAMAQTHTRLGDEASSTEMMKLAEKYRSGELRAPPRRHNHRYWNLVIGIDQ